MKANSTNLIPFVLETFLAGLACAARARAALRRETWKRDPLKRDAWKRHAGVPAPTLQPFNASRFNPSTLPRLLASTALAVALAGAAHAQHLHVNAGALSTAQDAQLYFVNGGSFVSNSGFLVNLTFTNAGPYANYHQGGITFTALPASADNGGPAFGHSAPGSFLQLEVVSVRGPEGGAWGFWESGDAAPRFSVASGTAAGTNRFHLSESQGNPGDDPYGHIHGRRFTTTQPGLYTVGFRILDTSTNGTGGGPIHTPSDLFPMYFQAGHTIDSMTTNGVTNLLVFGSQLSRTFHLESTTNLNAPVQWTNLAGPLVGTNRLQTLEHWTGTESERYYRLRVTQP